MIMALLMAVLVTAAAWPYVRYCAAGDPWPWRAGASFLGGAAVAALSLYALSAIGVAWSRAALVAVVVVIGASGYATLRGLQPVVRASAPRLAGRWSWAIDAMSGLVLVGYGLLATAGPSPENDFVGIWGVKAHRFFVQGSVDWSFLARPESSFMHADYPLLLPLLFDTLAVVGGAWNSETLGLLYPAMAAAVLLMLRVELSRSMAPLGAAACTFALTGVAASPYIGLAEGPLVSYATAAMLTTRRAVLDRDPRLLLLGSAFFGLAALVKNEGLSWMVAAVIGAVIAWPSWRAVRVLAIAPLLAMTWIVPRTIVGLETDLTRPGILQRAAEHLRTPEIFFEMMAKYPLGRPLLWLGIALALVVGFRRLLAERFAVATLGLQFAAILTAYVITPHDLDWHFRWSWERVINQLALPLAFLSMIVIARELRFQVEDEAPNV